MRRFRSNRGLAAVTADLPPTLSLRGVHKTFGGVTAIEEINLDVRAGEIVALVGDNGAGKSTLIKIVAGVQPATRGEIRVDGEPADLKTPADSQDRGIQVVYQDLALAERQPVYMNLFLGRELTLPWLGKLNRGRMIAEAESLMRELDVRIPSARALVSELSGGQRQGIAIARATHWASKLVLMDEPTAALGIAETERVEKIIAGLKARNLAILLVSHNLDQVFRLADRICVLRRGRQIGVRDTHRVGRNEIVAMITGLAA
jgi:simple sugar transport system ATP-binding protein